MRYTVTAASRPAVLQHDRAYSVRSSTELLVPEGHITWHTTGDAVQQVPIAPEVLQAPREALFACVRCHQYAFTYPSRFGSHIVGVPADALSASDGAAVSVTVYHIDSRHWEEILDTAITAAGAADVSVTASDPPAAPVGGEDWESSIRDAAAAAAGAGGGSAGGAATTSSKPKNSSSSQEDKNFAGSSARQPRFGSGDQSGWGENAGGTDGDSTPPLPPNGDSGSDAGDSDLEEPTPPRPVRHTTRAAAEAAAPSSGSEGGSAGNGSAPRGAAAAASRLHRAGFPVGTAQHHAPAYVYAAGGGYHSDALINTARFMDASLPPRAISGSGLAAPLPAGPSPPQASAAASGTAQASFFDTNTRIVQNLGRKLPRASLDSTYASHSAPSSGVSPLGPLSGAAPQHATRTTDDSGERGASPDSAAGVDVYSPSVGRSSPFAPVVYDASNMRKVDPSPPSAHSLRSSATSSAASSGSRAGAAAAALTRVSHVPSAAAVATGGSGSGLPQPVAARRLAMSPAIGQEQSFTAASRRASAPVPQEAQPPHSAGSGGSDVDRWWRRTASGALVSASSEGGSSAPGGGSAALNGESPSRAWHGVQGLASGSPPGTPSRSPQSPAAHDMLNASYLSAASAASSRGRHLDWSAASSVPNSARGTPVVRGPSSRVRSTPGGGGHALPDSPVEYEAPVSRTGAGGSGGRIRGGVSEGLSAAGVGPTGAGIAAPPSTVGTSRGPLEKTPTRVKPGRKGATGADAAQGAADISAAALTALVDGSPAEAAVRPGGVAQKGVAATSPAQRDSPKEKAVRTPDAASSKAQGAAMPQPAAPMQAPAAAGAAPPKHRSPSQNNVPQPTPQRQGVPRRSYLTRTAGAGGTRVHSTADGVPLAPSPVTSRLDSLSPASDAGSAMGSYHSPRAVSGAVPSPSGMGGMLSAPVPGTGSVSAAVASAAASVATGGVERPSRPPPRSAQRDAAVAKAERAAEESRSQLQARAAIAQHNAHTGVAAAALTGVRQPKSPHRLGPKGAQQGDDVSDHDADGARTPSPTSSSGATGASNPGSGGGTSGTGGAGKGQSSGRRRGRKRDQAHGVSNGHEL